MADNPPPTTSAPNTTTTDYRSLAKTCMNEHYWPYYVASIVIVFFGGLLCILLFRLCKAIIRFAIKRRRLARVAKRDWHGTTVGSSVLLDASGHINNSIMSGLEQAHRSMAHLPNRPEHRIQRGK